MKNNKFIYLLFLIMQPSKEELEKLFCQLQCGDITESEYFQQLKVILSAS